MLTPNALQILLGQPWVERFGWALVHFLWQGALIAIVYAIARNGLRRAGNPQVRYLLACAALIAMVAAPIVTFPMTGESDASARSIPVAVPHVPSHAVGVASTDPISTLAMQTWRDDVMPWIVMGWFAGVIVFWVRLMGGWIVAARMRSMLVRPAPAEWQRALDQLRTRIRVSRPVRLLVSALVEVPTIVGWLRPVVLVPVGALAGLPAEHVEAILAHELAHIRRHDYLVNILQSVAEALLFYHPAVWWISNHIRSEREHCCDDVAVAVNGDAIVYARALAELESYRPAHFNSALAANGGSLPERIGRLLGQSMLSQSKRPIDALPGPGVVAAAILFVTMAWGMFGQPVHARPAFEVASVKLNQETAGATYLRPQVSGNRVTWHNVTVAQVAFYAYRLLGSFQVAGSLQLAPGHNWYDFEAVAPGPPTDDDLHLMFQTLLEDRFKLKVHRETKELAGFDLVVAKNGSKLKESQPESQLKVDGKPIGSGASLIVGSREGVRLVGRGVSVAQMAATLGGRLSTPVRDRTGLTGLFDYNVIFNADDNGSGTSTAPDLTTAIQEELGLKLEKSKVPVEMLVVDHIENPSEN